MTAKIHETAIVSPKAILGVDVAIGPYCCVGDQVQLGDRVVLRSHVTIDGHTEIGEGTEIYPFASIGLPPQDLKYKGEPSTLKIGKFNRIREYVTMQPGTESGTMETRVGDYGLFMAGAHVAHDCTLGNHVNMANYATLSGHVVVGNHVTIGGLAAVHQFVRIGDFAFIGGMAGIKYDVIPYALVMGRPANLAGLNIVGLKRQGVSRQNIEAMKQAYAKLFDRSQGTLSDRVAEVIEGYGDSEQVQVLSAFLQEDSSRSICLPEVDNNAVLSAA